MDDAFIRSKSTDSKSMNIYNGRVRFLFKLHTGYDPAFGIELPGNSTTTRPGSFDQIQYSSLRAFIDMDSEIFFQGNTYLQIFINLNKF
jgi:hypothetical protein